MPATGVVEERVERLDVGIVPVHPFPEAVVPLHGDAEPLGQRGRGLDGTT